MLLTKITLNVIANRDVIGALYNNLNINFVGDGIAEFQIYFHIESHF